MPGDDTHHQPRTRARIAEIERPLGRPETANAPPLDLPDVAALLGNRPERNHGPRRIYDILGFEQSRNARCTSRQSPENQRPMRYGFIARDADTPLERLRPERGQRFRCGFRLQDKPSKPLEMGRIWHFPGIERPDRHWAATLCQRQPWAHVKRSITGDLDAASLAPTFSF